MDSFRVFKFRGETTLINKKLGGKLTIIGEMKPGFTISGFPFEITLSKSLAKEVLRKVVNPNDKHKMYFMMTQEGRLQDEHPKGKTFDATGKLKDINEGLIGSKTFIGKLSTEESKDCNFEMLIGRKFTARLLKEMGIEWGKLDLMRESRSPFYIKRPNIRGTGMKMYKIRLIID